MVLTGSSCGRTPFVQAHDATIRSVRPLHLQWQPFRGPTTHLLLHVSLPQTLELLLKGNYSRGLQRQRRAHAIQSKLCHPRMMPSPGSERYAWTCITETSVIFRPDTAPNSCWAGQPRNVRMHATLCSCGSWSTRNGKGHVPETKGDMRPASFLLIPS
jgi:hypothetical protein